MEIEGKIWKEGNWWLVEIPSLDAMSQAKTRKEALLMAKDLVKEMMKSYFEEEIGRGFRVDVSDDRKNTIFVTTNETKLLMSLSLRRQREKSGSTIKEAAGRLGSKSPNSYAQYERGTTNITIEKFEALLFAANPSDQVRLKLV